MYSMFLTFSYGDGMTKVGESALTNMTNFGKLILPQPERFCWGMYGKIVSLSLNKSNGHFDQIHDNVISRFI